MGNLVAAVEGAVGNAIVDVYKLRGAGVGKVAGVVLGETMAVKIIYVVTLYFLVCFYILI